MSDIWDQAAGHSDIWDQAAKVAPGKATSTGAASGFAEPGRPKFPIPQPEGVFGNLQRNLAMPTPKVGDIPALASQGPELGPAPDIDRFKAIINAPTTDTRLGATSNFVRGLAPSMGSQPFVLGMPGVPSVSKAASIIGAGAGALAGHGTAALLGAGPGGEQLGEDIGAGVGGALGGLPFHPFGVKSPSKALIATLPGMTTSTKEEDLPFLEEAISHIKKTVQENTPATSRIGVGAVPSSDITTPGQLQTGAQALSHKMNEAYNQWLDRFHNTGAQPNPGPAILESFDKGVRVSDQNYAPEEVAAERARLQQAFDRPMSIYDIDKLRTENGVSEMYKKTPGAQYQATMQGTDQAIQSQRRAAVSNFLYNQLDPHNNGAGPAYLKQLQSQVMNVINGAAKAWGKSVTEEPWSNAEALGGALKAGVSAGPRFLTGQSIDAAPMQGKTNAAITRIFKSVKPPESELPVPQGPYPTIGPQLQLAGPNPGGAPWRESLNQGTIVPPAPPDPSGTYPGQSGIMGIRIQPPFNPPPVGAFTAGHGMPPSPTAAPIGPPGPGTVTQPGILPNAFRPEIRRMGPPMSPNVLRRPPEARMIPLAPDNMQPM